MKVDAILVPGKASYHYWSRHFDNVYVVHYYALESKMMECPDIQANALRQKLGIPGDTVVILYMGRLIKKKGVDLVIRAFAELIRRERYSRAMLVIAGDGPDKQCLIELCANLGVQGNVLFLGAIPESRKKCIYNLSDIFVYFPIVLVIPEEWPIAPLEAMSSGVCTVVSTAVGSLPDIAKGVIAVRVGDVDSLVRTLAKLIDDHDMRRRIANDGVTVWRIMSNESLVFREFMHALLKTLQRKLRSCLALSS